MTLRVVSLCSGIEAASVAALDFDWNFVAFSEIDKFASAVLAHHWPETPNVGDMTTADWSLFAAEQPVDVLVGGTPCQAFSVAGLRRGMADARGNLTMTFVGIADELDPPYVFWENVPGVLSDRSNAFGCFLGALAGEDDPLEPPGGRWTNCGYVLGPRRAIAWRVLDAQYFGVAQRRRRVFVVACPRNGSDPREILFERDGLRRDTAPRREAGARVAGALEGGVRSGADDNDARGHRLVGVDLRNCSLTGGIAQTLQSHHASNSLNAEPTVLAFGGNRTSGPTDIAAAVNAHGGPHGRLDFESETFVASPAFQCHGTNVGPMGHLRSGNGATTGGVPFLAVAFAENSRAELRLEGGDGQTTGALKCNGGKPGQSYPVCITGAIGPLDTDPGTIGVLAFSVKDHGADAGPLAPTLRAMPHDGSHANGGGQLGVAYTIRADAMREGTAKTPSPDAEGRIRLRDPGLGIYADQAPTLDRGAAHGVAAGAMRVRRLTPVECERLQGFPDGYTAIPWRGGSAPDGPRCKALGNSWAVPCVRWIFARIDADAKRCCLRV